jgi:predicted metal-dependent peptidase
MEKEVTEYQYNNAQILEDVNKVSSRFILQEVFYAHFFSGMLKSVGVEMPTMAVGYDRSSTFMHINPQFWEQELGNLDYQYGGVKHEILHIVLKHIFRYKDFSNKEIFNIAADLVVNQLIERHQLIDGAVFLENFPELDLLTHQSSTYYYNKLMAFHKEMQEEQENGGNECQNSTSGKSLNAFLDPNSQVQNKHYLWQRIGEMSNAEREIAEQSINQNIQNAIKRTKTDQFGKLPASLQQYLREFELSMMPKVNWKRILKLFATSSSRTYIKNTLKRPSKRYGVTPGIKIKKKNRILVAIDTSGSIIEEELREFFSEIYHIWRQGAEVLIVECDAAIQQKYLYKGNTPKTVKGGGGTDFTPPIKYANEEFHPDAIIYFTDGYADVPKVKSRCAIMWLLTKQGADETALKNFEGRKLKMN